MLFVCFDRAATYVYEKEKVCMHVYLEIVVACVTYFWSTLIEPPPMHVCMYACMEADIQYIKSTVNLWISDTWILQNDLMVSRVLNGFLVETGTKTVESRFVTLNYLANLSTDTMLLKS